MGKQGKGYPKGLPRFVSTSADLGRLKSAYLRAAEKASNPHGVKRAPETKAQKAYKAFARDSAVRVIRKS